MSDGAPIFASERTAARLFDMKSAEFRALVQAGHLPKPHSIAPGVLRWDVDELRQIKRGQRARPDDGLEL